MNLPEDFVFTQSSLQDYTDCPRRFQLRYVEQRRWPAPEVDDVLEFERRMQRGDHFHHLVHQHLVGIPAETLLRWLHDADMSRWFDCYLQTGLTGLPEARYPELTLTTLLGDYDLLAKFDVVAVQPGERAVIMDWKTSPNPPPSVETLAQRWQTIIYRYVLAQGGSHLNGGQPIPPEQIEMIYWYADHGGAVRRLPYDRQQFQADEARLRQLVAEIDARADFPLTPEVRRCRFCVYRSLCDRGQQAGSLADYDEDAAPGVDRGFTLDLDQIDEIEF